MNIDEHLLVDKLNLETAQISWQELQPYFAKGITVYLTQDIDLIETAEAIAQDKVEIITQLIDSKKMGQISNEQAQTWNDYNQLMWAVVVAPWVLIQEVAII